MWSSHAPSDPTLTDGFRHENVRSADNQHLIAMSKVARTCWRSDAAVRSRRRPVLSATSRWRRVASLLASSVADHRGCDARLAWRFGRELGRVGH